MSEEERLRRVLARARSLASAEVAVALYRDWAAQYDADVFGRLAFTGSARIADLLASRLGDRNAGIVDLGCGTGAVAERLAALGHTRIDGLDLSPEMLAVAGGKGVYRRLAVADLTQPLDIADASYGAAISAGTFTSGHVGAAALPEILRIVAGGGLFACVVAQAFWEPGGFAAAIPELEGQGRIRLLHDSLEPIRAGGEPEGRFLVMEVRT